MRKICVVTGSRAEYGLLYWLLKEIQSDKELQLQLIVTGMHLSPEFGLTYKLIEKDGFVIDKKVEMLLSSDSSVGISKSIGLGVISFSESLEFLNPDIVVLLGDRFEILAAATAALIGSIPIAHIHGGEITEGAFDESIRHSITKFAYLHFVAAEEYRKRVIQLGENPERVFNFGAPGLDLLSKMHWMDKKEIEEDLGVQLNHPIFLVTYHPVTLGTNNPEKPMNELLNALENFPGSTIIFTYPNSDTGGRIIIDLINSFVSKNDLSRKAYVSLGAKRYTSLMKLSDVIIGNSSSGIIEAPALKKPTVNLGDRQKGRLKANSIIDCLEEKESIISGIQKALSKEFQEVVRHTVSLYGEGNVSLRIKDKLKTSHLEKRKIFFDLNHSY